MYDFLQGFLNEQHLSSVVASIKSVEEDGIKIFHLFSAYKAGLMSSSSRPIAQNIPLVCATAELTEQQNSLQ